MKIKGFTLAEVLITLGIIGVVAAITLPALMTDTTSAQIGPKLAKAVSMFEQANEAMLNGNSVDTLSDAGLLSSEATYSEELSKYLKGTTSDSTKFLTKDGMKYTFTITNSAPANSSDPGHLQRIGNVTVDINGKSEPNKSGTDIFYFSWWNDGSLRPWGSSNWNGDSTGDSTWQNDCPKAEDGAVINYNYCAAHIFENDLKVLYR